jgi:hypothetical protein
MLHGFYSYPMKKTGLSCSTPRPVLKVCESNGCPRDLGSHLIKEIILNTNLTLLRETAFSSSHVTPQDFRITLNHKRATYFLGARVEFKAAVE